MLLTVKLIVSYLNNLSWLFSYAGQLTAVTESPPAWCRR